MGLLQVSSGAKPKAPGLCSPPAACTSQGAFARADAITSAALFSLGGEHKGFWSAMYVSAPCEHLMHPGLPLQLFFSREMQKRERRGKQLPKAAS